MRVLTRACLREATGHFLFYGSVYLALIAVAVATPLLKQGAPLMAVIAFLPDQLLLISVLALPLALVTALLATVGRMREEGELTALQAAGVGTWKVALALLPLALGLAVWMGLFAHLLLPRVALGLMQGRSDLLRQALTAQVGRRAPIYQGEEGTIVAADGVDGDRLLGVFGVVLDRNGGITACFAPSARWVADPDALSEAGASSGVTGRTADGEIAGMGLELLDARLLSREAAAAGKPPRVTSGDIPDWTVLLPDKVRDFADRADMISTPELLRRIATPRTQDSDWVRRSYERAFHTRLLLPVLPLVYWAFAVGLALAMGRGNRMLAVCLGLVTVVATLVPSYGLAKEIGERVSFNAGWLVWPANVALAAAGGWLLWRHR